MALTLSFQEFIDDVVSEASYVDTALSDDLALDTDAMALLNSFELRRDPWNMAQFSVGLHNDNKGTRQPIRTAGNATHGPLRAWDDPPLSSVHDYFDFVRQLLQVCAVP